MLDALEAAHPGFKEKLLDDQGGLVRYVNLFVDDDDVRFMDGLSTPVPDGGTLSIMQAVAGGLEPQRSGRRSLLRPAAVPSGVPPLWPPASTRSGPLCTQS